MSGYMTKLNAEEMRFSSAFNIWATVKEYPLLTHENTQLSSPPVHKYATIYPQDKPNPINSQSPQGSSDKITEARKIQLEARTRVKTLLSNSPKSQFYQSLNHWYRDFTDKQLNAINKCWRDYKSQEKDLEKQRDEKFDSWVAKNSSITEEEENDPSWTPWK